MFPVGIETAHTEVGPAKKDQRFTYALEKYLLITFTYI